MNLKDFFEAVNYRITEGSEYCWNCFGPNAYMLDSHVLEQYSVSILFDTRTQIVYQVELADYRKDLAYIWTNPYFRQYYIDEAKIRDIDPMQAWDEVKFTEIEIQDEMLEKIRAVVNNKPYDTRVAVPIDLDDATLYQLMTMAHEQDITLNQLVNNILREMLD